MAELLLNSTKVKVYPTAFRGNTSDNITYDPESRLNTEFNITNVINRLLAEGHDSL